MTGRDEPSGRSWATGSLDEQTFAALAERLPGTELQSVLLEVMRRRAIARTPRDVLAQYRRDRFVRPAPVDLRVSLELDLHLLTAASAFTAIDLSPVAPLGTCSTMALTDQHRTLSALRGTEVVSDPTNVLALECAERLRAAPNDAVHLTTSQRVIRAQQFPNKPGYSAHFRLFALASAGRERKDHAFAIETMTLHIATMQRALDRLEQNGYAFGARRVDILAREDRAHVGDRIAAAVATAASYAVARKPLDHAYYSGGIRYMLWVTNRAGEEVPLADGGLFDWLPKLTANARHVYVASGLGAQLAAYAFRV